MKRTFVVAFFLIQSHTIIAQDTLSKSNRFSLNIGVENHLPLIPFSKSYNYGLGASIITGYKLFRSFNLTFEPAYYLFFYSIPSVDIRGSTSYVTFFLGGRFYVSDEIYVRGKLGYSIKMVQPQNERAFAYGGGAGIDLFKRFNAELQYIRISVITSPPKILSMRFGYYLKK